MTLARDTMKKLKAQGWAEFSHRKSAATGTSTCICASSGLGRCRSASSVVWAGSRTSEGYADNTRIFYLRALSVACNTVESRALRLHAQLYLCLSLLPLCADVMEDDEKKHRDVYALLTGALLGVPKDSFKWVLTWTTQHRATEIVEFFSAK